MMQSLEEILLEEIRDREALDAQYYQAVKQDAMARAQALGIAPDVVARLYGTAPL